MEKGAACVLCTHYVATAKDPYGDREGCLLFSKSPLGNIDVKEQATFCLVCGELLRVSKGVVTPRNGFSTPSY